MERSLAGLMALSLALALVPPARAEIDLLRRFEGAYDFAGGPDETRRLEQAIDAVVDRLNVLVRGIARSEIRREIQPERTIVLAPVGRDRLRFSLGAWGPVEVSLDNRAQQVTGPDGSDTQLRGLVTGNRIVLVQDSPRGRRTNWLSLGSDGRWLHLQVQVDADQLPGAIQYSLSYLRR